ncbi:DUF1559 family PulG-like putative transporter [Thalassoglobus neptunius]|nr:DUF1559 domain-containing protein [Thalassoglobus neptunius]
MQRKLQTTLKVLYQKMPRTSRNGISQVELLIVIAVIGILVAVFLPAVQSTRETARRVQCGNQMRQIGVALAAFEASHGHFPARDTNERSALNWISSLMPFLGQTAFYDRVIELYGGSAEVDPVEGVRLDYNRLNQLTPPGFHCPSDPAPAVGTTSYAGNSGTWGLHFQHDGVFRFAKPIWLGYRPGVVSSEAIVDGLSNTVIVSEWVHRHTDHRWQSVPDTPRRVIWKLPIYPAQGGDLDMVVEECLQVPKSWPARYGWRENSRLGEHWYGASNGYSTYYHALQPNRMSCDPVIGAVDGNLTTAGSFHPGGVNGLFADGHLMFVSENIVKCPRSLNQAYESWG